jgi:WD40 repeat protein/TPR repeat protein
MIAMTKDEAVNLDTENPWPGLMPFTEGTEAFFHGRDEEVEELSRRVRRDTLTVLFGRSGLGKTSLLSAGLFPLLRAEDFLPVYVEFAFGESNPSPVEQVKTALRDNLDKYHIEARRPLPEETLWGYFHEKDSEFWGRRNRLITPVLVFDQLEEVFTRGQNASSRGTLFDELAALVENRAPERVRREIEDDPDQSARYDFGKEYYKVVFALREEYLADLEDLRRLMPSVMANRMRLTRMNRTQAREVILKSGRHLVTDEVAEQLLNYVAANRSRHFGDTDLAAFEIEPALLSLVCRELNNKRLRAGRARITADLLGNTQDEIVAGFYRESLTRMDPAVKLFIEDQLVTDEGYRDSRPLAEALRAPGVTPAAIDHLVDRRLLRIEGRFGTDWVELAHDLLIDVIRHEGELRREREAEAERHRIALKAAQERAAPELDQSRLLTERARKAASVGKPELAGLIAQAALPTDMDAPDKPIWFPALSVLAEARSQARQRALLWGHAAEVNSAAFSPDGAHVVTASADHTARLWDATTGAQLAVLLGHTSFVNSAAFSADGLRIATASADGTARLWDASNGAQLAVLLGHTSFVNSAAFSPDGARIVTASADHTIRLWETANAVEVAVFGQANIVNTAAFSPNGIRLVIASGENAAFLCDARTGARLAALQGHTSFVSSAAFSPDGGHIVTASADHTARLWDAETGEQVAVLHGHAGEVTSAAFSADGARVVTACRDNTASLWNWASAERVAVLREHTNFVTGAAFSPDGARVVTASADHTVRLWDATIGGELAVLVGHTSFVSGAEFSPEGKHVVTASGDHTARLWDAASGVEIVAFRGHAAEVNSAAFSPDRTRVVTASADHTARLWDANNGASRAVLDGHTSFINSAAFSPDGARVVTASADHTARLWDATTDAPLPLTVLKGHSSFVNSAAFSPDGARVVTASADHTAQLWDAATGVRLAVLQGHASFVSSAAFSPDGGRIVTASADHTARLWDATTGGQVAVLEGHTSFVTGVAFSPDGARVVTASADRTAQLWDAATGAPVALLRGHTAEVTSAAFSPDGTRVVTTSLDNTARLWAVWPLLTADTVTYAAITALRGLAKADLFKLLPYAAARDQTEGGLATVAAVTAESECDRLAAEPLDTFKQGPGVPFGNIDADKAIPACRSAVQTAPGDVRFRYQLGRALARAGEAQEAVELFRRAAEQGYAAAANALGDLFRRGIGVPQSGGEALSLYRQAVEGGYVRASSHIGELYWQGNGVALDRAEALGWFVRGAEDGDPFSHRHLAERYELGDQVSRDLEKALFHRTIEAGLFEQAGEEPEAAAARARRGSLARSLAPEAAVHIAREAAAWRPSAREALRREEHPSDPLPLVAAEPGCLKATTLKLG